MKPSSEIRVRVPQTARYLIDPVAKTEAEGRTCRHCALWPQADVGDVGIGPVAAGYRRISPACAAVVGKIDIIARACKAGISVSQAGRPSAKTYRSAACSGKIGNDELHSCRCGISYNNTVAGYAVELGVVAEIRYSTDAPGIILALVVLFVGSEKATLVLDTAMAGLNTRLARSKFAGSGKKTSNV